MRRQRLLLGLCCAVAFVACKTDPPKAKKTTQPKPVQEEVAEQPQTEPEKEVKLNVPDRIYGMPVPDKVIGYVQFPASSQIITELDLEQLEHFYAKNLVDYEVISDNGTLQIVGLRDYMSRAEARPLNKRSKKSEITFFDRQKTSEEVVSLYGDGKPKKRGDVVELRTSDGKPLAPGARWYEPYTPPPGSPLDKPKYKANFGLPFGKWTNN